jgi:APA family basic amino acid/polyamine antiporter
MGIIPSSELVNSTAPFADTAAIIWGEQARYWIAAAALISTFGALNGWILLQGQIPLAASRDKLFPQFLSHENSNGVPSTGIIISSVLISLLLTLNFSESLGKAFTTLILLATVTSVVAFLFSAAAYVIILSKTQSTERMRKPIALASIAFFYSLWAIIGSGQEAVYWGFVAILMGIPFYVWMKQTADSPTL